MTCDVKRTFKCATDLVCKRGFISRHIILDSGEKQVMCDTSSICLSNAATPEEGVVVERI